MINNGHQGVMQRPAARRSNLRLTSTERTSLQVLSRFQPNKTLHFPRFVLLSRLFLLDLSGPVRIHTQVMLLKKAPNEKRLTGGSFLSELLWMFVKAYLN